MEVAPADLVQLWVRDQMHGGLHLADLMPQVVLERVGGLGDVSALVLQGTEHIV